MNVLNTTKKGDEFELQVFAIIKDLLDKDDFFVPGKRSKIFWQKTYKSNITNDEIIIDVSIETYLPNAEKYSQLTIFECKNYKPSIPVSVDKIRVLRSVMQEIGAHKGVIISKTRFQKGVIDTAKATNVGLCIINTKNQLDWINYRVDRIHNQYSIDKIDSILTENSDKSFFAYSNSGCFENLPDLLINLGVIDKFQNKQEFVNIPYKSEELIKKEVYELPRNVYIENKLDTDELAKFLAEKYNVEFIFDNNLDMYNHNKILGKISFNPLKIYVTNELIEDYYRWRFTFAHEVGHLILHSDILRNFISDNFDNEQTIFQSDISERINKRMEIQANIFATKLLLPEEPFIKLVQQYFIKERIHKKYLYLDNQPCNRNLVNNLLGEIKYKFGVSLEVGKIKLKNLNLLVDKTENSIGAILRNY